MAPSPLSTSTVLITLDWIAPPSLLSPFPPHLISSALRQRHHFLNISPDNPSEYLTWPSNCPTQGHTVIELLEALPKPIEHLNCYVRYSVDEESAFAHVEIPSDPPGLRLIFQWDPDGWKYHNIALMPFPPNTFESLQEAASFIFVSQSPTVVFEEGDDGSYWDAYSRDGDHEGYITSKEPEPLSTEDAYWARYTSVHGSGDSAIPTPILPSMNPEKAFERVLLPLSYHHPSDTCNPLEPPSPHALARYLADLPPRPESPLDEADSGSSSNSAPSPSSSSTASCRLALLPPLSDSTKCRTRPYQSYEAPPYESKDSSEALRNTIRGVYDLWKSARQTKSPALEEEFLEIVRQVVAE